MRRYISGTAIKNAVLGIFLLALALQMMQAIWISQYRTTTSKSESECKHTEEFHGDIIATSRIVPSSRILYIPTSTKMRTTPMSDHYRWKSGDIQCSYKNDPRQAHLRDVLPSKYAEVLWPPSNLSLCGEGELLSPWSLNRNRKVWMTFIVKSAPHHFAYRNAVRSTWGSVTWYQGKNLAIIFLIGTPNSTNNTRVWQKALQKENDLFGDILQCFVADTYRNLPIKVLQSFYWIANRYVTESFFTFTDNDCLMRISNIYAFFTRLTKAESDDNVYCGFRYDAKGKTERRKSSKWHVSKEQYSFERYPTFCHGGMYTMKIRRIRSILCVCAVTNITQFPLEDVLITGILRRKLGNWDENIKPVTTPSGRRYDVMYYPWEGTQPQVLWKMNHKWNFWNKSLHQYRATNLVQMRTANATDKLEVERLLHFWRGYT